MRKISALLMALVMAVPVFATPLCAATCGDEPGTRFSCCCTAKGIDGTPSYTAPPCCPADTDRTDLRNREGAVSAGSAANLTAGIDQGGAVALSLAAADALAAAPVSFVGSHSGRTRATGPPIFLAVSSLRL